MDGNTPRPRWLQLLLRACAMSLALAAPLAQAQTMGYPQVTFDSRSGPGQNLFTTQGVHFIGDTGWAVSARALSISFDGVTSIPLSNGTVDLKGSFVSASVGPGFVTGNLTTVDGVNPDLILADDSGVLLAGVYGARHISGVLGATTGVSDSTFTVVGGSLAPFYAQWENRGQMLNTLFDIAPAFSAESFQHDFDGHIDGRFGPAVPEPATLASLGIGLFVVGLSAWRRRQLPVA